MLKFLKELFCRHDWNLNAGYYQSGRRCRKCGKFVADAAL